MGQHEDTQNCFDTDDGEEAINRVRALVKTYAKAACAPKFILLTQPDCVPCDEARERFADGIKDGSIRTVSLDSQEGIKIVDKNKISAIPTLLLLDCQDQVITSDIESESV